MLVLAAGFAHLALGHRSLQHGPLRRVRGVAARIVALSSLVAALFASLAMPVLAHGVIPGPWTPVTALTAWSIDPSVWLPIGAAFFLYRAGVERVNRLHPDNPVPRHRVWAWNSGLLVLLIALQSSIDLYSETLFSIHMVQHLLLTMVVPPLMLLGAPVTLLLRASSPERRHRVWLPILHSRFVRLVSHPVVGWTVFAGVMWFSHFTPLFDAALENAAVHYFEHVLYVIAGFLFWWPVVAVDPAPRKLPHAIRVGYLLIGMPWSAFLGFVLFSAPRPLYENYVRLQLDWGLSPLADQELAGGIMWAGGDLLFFIAILFAVRAWFQAEDLRAKQLDAQLDRDERARQTAERQVII